MESFLKPFQIQIQQKKVKLDCVFEHSGQTYDDGMYEELKHLICLDFKIFDCIMFQLISNAIKHCNSDSTIKIIFQFKLRD